MRCLACNKNLNDWESTVKTPSGHYLDLCRFCLSSVKEDIDTRGNPLLSPDEEVLDTDSDTLYNSYLDGTEG